MNTTFGTYLRTTVWGQSHAAAIGCTVEGLPAGEAVDEEALCAFMGRRAPGGRLSTQRRETDQPEILCGLMNGITCGAPLTALIRNTDQRSKDYKAIADRPRPSHADLPAQVRYQGFQDVRGGGAFSGKDCTKVDRSAAYAARHIAKNMVAAGIADEILIQISYAIGIAKPVGIFVNTYGTAKINLNDSDIARKIEEIFDLRPKAIEERLKLRNPIYLETASYGHMGRTPRMVKKTYSSNYWPTIEKEVELFTWEKLDYVETIRKAFQL